MCDDIDDDGSYDSDVCIDVSSKGCTHDDVVKRSSYRCINTVFKRIDSYDT